MRCDNCTQLTQESDFAEVERADGTVAEVCGWCAAEMERQKVAQPLIQNQEGLF